MRSEEAKFKCKTRLTGRSKVEDLQSPGHRAEGLRGEGGRMAWGPEAAAGGAAGGRGGGAKAASSGQVLFSGHFLHGALLSVLRFRSSSVQPRICFPITDDVICHLFVYSL